MLNKLLQAFFQVLPLAQKKKEKTLCLAQLESTFPSLALAWLTLIV